MEKICQSCGMPLTRDPKGGGTNRDGSKSSEYCSYCYQDGTWMNEMTVDQMQERVGGFLKRDGVPSSVLDRAVSGIPGLKRWKR